MLIYLWFKELIHTANGLFTGKPQMKTSHRYEIHLHCLYQCPRSCCDKRALLQETQKNEIFYAQHCFPSAFQCLDNKIKLILQMVETLKQILLRKTAIWYRSRHLSRCFSNRTLPNQRLLKEEKQLLIRLLMNYGASVK